MSTDRAMALGNQLIDIHVWPREELADLRAEVDVYLKGKPDRQRNLRAHCLTFCSATHGRRHRGVRGIGGRIP